MMMRITTVTMAMYTAEEVEAGVNMDMETTTMWVMLLPAKPPSRIAWVAHSRRQKRSAQSSIVGRACNGVLKGRSVEGRARLCAALTLVLQYRVL